MYSRPDMSKPDWEDFGRRVLERWREGDMNIDMCDVQDWAEETGIIAKIPGGFDPEKHTDTIGCAEPGDDWYQMTT